MGTKYQSFKLQEEIVVYRGGAEGRPLGEYFSLERPTSELQTRIDKALLPKWPGGGRSVVDTGYALRIPKGTIVHMGDVAPQGNIFLGGTKQLFIEKPWLNKNIEVVEQFSLKEDLLWNLKAKY